MTDVSVEPSGCPAGRGDRTRACAGGGIDQHAITHVLALADRALRLAQPHKTPSRAQCDGAFAVSALGCRRAFVYGAAVDVITRAARALRRMGFIAGTPPIIATGRLRKATVNRRPSPAAAVANGRSW